MAVAWALMASRHAGSAVDQTAVLFDNVLYDTWYQTYDIKSARSAANLFEYEYKDFSADTTRSMKRAPRPWLEQYRLPVAGGHARTRCGSSVDRVDPEGSITVARNSRSSILLPGICRQLACFGEWWTAVDDWMLVGISSPRGMYSYIPGTEEAKRVKKQEPEKKSHRTSTWREAQRQPPPTHRHYHHHQAFASSSALQSNLLPSFFSSLLASAFSPLGGKCALIRMPVSIYDRKKAHTQSQEPGKQVLDEYVASGTTTTTTTTTTTCLRV